MYKKTQLSDRNQTIEFWYRAIILKKLCIIFIFICLLQLKSSCIQLIIGAFLGNQFIVVSSFDYTSVVKHHDNV